MGAQGDPEDFKDVDKSTLLNPTLKIQPTQQTPRTLHLSPMLLALLEISPSPWFGETSRASEHIFTTKITPESIAGRDLA